MALTADRDTKRRDGIEFELPVLASTKIYAGALVAIIASSTGANYATKGAAATNLLGVGVAKELADNSAGADGAINVKVRRGTFLFKNSAAGDAIARANIGSNCYIVDDETVAKTDGTGTRSVAGKVRDVDSSGVWVEF